MYKIKPKTFGAKHFILTKKERKKESIFSEIFSHVKKVEACLELAHMQNATLGE